MRKYVAPDVSVVPFDQSDVITASNTTNQEGLGFDGYDFGGTWL